MDLIANGTYLMLKRVLDDYYHEGEKSDILITFINGVNDSLLNIEEKEMFLTYFCVDLKKALDKVKVFWRIMAYEVLKTWDRVNQIDSNEKNVIDYDIFNVYDLCERSIDRMDFLLREFVHPAFFNILIWFLCAFGTFEVVRALKEYNTKFIKLFAFISGIVVIPLYVCLDYFLGINGLLITISYLLITVIIYFVYSFVKFNDVSFLGVIPFIYPSLLLLCMAGANNLVYNGFIALLLIFVISPFTDTMAYFTGMVYNKIKKGNAKKLCPKLSPKKTQAGAIGGLIGGAIGGILVYLVFRPEISIGLPFIVFAIIGLVASVLTQVGDLFESFIKRKVGLKDMGKIMPGHGGVMDRIDGITFASLFIYVVFLVI